MSSRVTGKPPAWRRPMHTRTYDYNMQLGENYYKPQLDYLETRRGRGKTPPSATTFAERLLKYPATRRSASASRRGGEDAEEIGFTRSSAAAQEARESLDRYASLDDLGLDESLVRRRRQLMISSQENLADSGPLSPGAGRQGRLAFGEKLLDAVGVKDVTSSSLQNLQESGLSSSSSSRMQKKSILSSSSSTRGGGEDALDTILAERKNRRQVQIQSADPDLCAEDPFKSASSSLTSRLQSARQQMDEMRQQIKQDSDATTSRFRKRMQQRRAREEAEDSMDFGSELASSRRQQSLASAMNTDFGSELGTTRKAQSSALSSRAQSSSSQMTSSRAVSSSSAMSSSKMGSSSGTLKITQGLSASAQNLMDDDDSDTLAILSKVEQIRKRAKARLQAINDESMGDDLHIESALANRRALTRASNEDLDADFGSSSSRVAGRSVAISQRTVKASYELD